MALPNELHPGFFSAGGGDLGDPIEQSLRFTNAAGPSLSKTMGAGDSRRKFTVSAWVKRGKIPSADQNHLWNYHTNPNVCALGFQNNQLRFYHYDSGGTFNAQYKSTAVFRDPSAWYHIIAVVDTTLSSANDRVKLWVNGDRITSFDTQTTFSQDYDTFVGLNNYTNLIGKYADGSSFKLSGYAASMVFLDGIAASETDFGRYNDDGVWVPKNYSGSYGTNGYNLTFDSSQSNGIGHDSSGNGNNFTASGFNTADVASYAGTIFTDSVNTGASATPNISSTASTFTNAFTNAFDGNTSTRIYTSVAGSWIIFRPSTAIPMSSGLRIWAEGAYVNQVWLNGSNTSFTTTGTTTWQTIPIGSETQITNIAIQGTPAPAAGATLFAIEVDGTILVHNTDNDVDFFDTPTSNFPTFNPLNSIAAVQNLANLQTQNTGGGASRASSTTVAVTTGKWYWEVYVNAVGTLSQIGIDKASTFYNLNVYPGQNGYGYQSNASKHTGGANVGSYGATFTTGDIIGVALNLDDGEIEFYKNGTSQGVAFTGIPSDSWLPAVDNYEAGTNNINLGQMPFVHTVPTGYGKIQTNNLPTPSIKDSSDHFQTLLGGGTGTFKFASESTTKTTEAIDFSELDQFTPALSDTNARSFILDTLEAVTSVSFTITNGWGWSGNTATIRVSATGAANSWTTTTSTQTMENNETVTVSNGSAFRYIRVYHNAGTVNFGDLSTTNQALLSRAQAAFPTGAWLVRARADEGNDAQASQWQWLDSVRGGTTALTMPFNTSGSAGCYLSTYDAPSKSAFAYCWNASSPATNGFQIIQDTSPTTGNNVISHNLGKTPEFIFTKETSNSDYANIYHVSLGTSHGLTNAGAVEHTNAFRVTAVSDSSFTIADSESSKPQIHYVWTSVPGFSQFGEYDQATAFVYTGFKPALLWIKKTAVAESWYVIDGERNPKNPMKYYTPLNSQGVEITSNGDRDVDFLSNGFKIRGTDSQISGAAQYVYMCWAENPFGGENTPPATGR